MNRETDDQITRLVASLRIEEKALLLTGKTAWRTWALPVIGLREMAFSDGPVGIRGTEETPGEVSNCLPSPSALAACWDVELAWRTGQWFAAEARAHDINVILAPLLNIQRTPISGRHFEYLSEDPLLVGDIAVAIIQGMQASGVAACVKHFVGNEVETDRTRYASSIDERTLREVYLAPFERAVFAGVWCVMAAYNRVDTGLECSSMVAHRHLLTDILKTEWGYQGPVISDWTAVRETTPPALAGLDLVMPGPDSPWSGGHLLKAITNNEIPSDILDDKVERILRLADKVGALQPLGHTSVLSSLPAAGLPTGGDPGLPREIAARSCVVLQNLDDALPLASPPQSIALIGPNAHTTRLLGGGSADVNIAHPVSLFDGLTGAFPYATITLNEGGSSRQTPPELDMALTMAPGMDSPGITVEYQDAGQQVISREVRTEWSGILTNEIPQGTNTIHLTLQVALRKSGEHWLGLGTVGRHRLMIDGQLIAASDHDAGDEVVVNSSFNVPPAEGTTLTVHSPSLVSVDAWIQCIPTQWGPKARAAFYHRPPGPTQAESIKQAAGLATSADLVIVVVGTNEETESEGWDRNSLELPGHQNELVDTILDRRPDAIILINAGAPVLLPWLEQARTVLWFWFPGQDAGTALADILTGKTEPSGRLPWTLPDIHDHCPVPYGLPDRNCVIEYSEQAHIGYRGWARSGHHPARPFGFGLGWTTWDICSAEVITHSDSQIQLSIQLRNAGTRIGSTVVQAYITGFPELDPARPVIWLAGYAHVKAQPGQTAATTITLLRRVFEIWVSASNDAPGHWYVPPGDYTISLGFNAQDHRIKVGVTWPG